MIFCARHKPGEFMDSLSNISKSFEEIFIVGPKA
jgi:hypothetical protein